MAKKKRDELKRERRRLRVRRKIRGTAERPRLSVYRSLRNFYAQLIDDLEGKTLLSVSTRDKEMASQKGNKCEKARTLGGILARKAKAKKIEKVVFDRGGCRYHGRIKAFAEGARAGGLQF